MIGVEFSLHPFKIHCTALKVRAMVVPLVGNVPVPGKGIPMAIPAGDPTVLGRGNTGNTGNAIGNTTGNEVAPGKGSLGNTGKDLGKINIMMIPAGNINTVQGNILVQEERKYGNLLVRNAPGTISKGDQADGKWHRKRKENDQDTEKFREIPGNSGKFREDVIKFVCLFVFSPFLFIFFLFSFKLSSRATGKIM